MVLTSGGGGNGASLAAAMTPARAQSTLAVQRTVPARADPRATNQQRQLDVERALVSDNPRLREMAFNVTLPELIDSDPERVMELVARQQGEARDLLRVEVVRQWIRKDRDAAKLWMGSLEKEERDASATIAMRTLAAIEPAQAVAVAAEFGVGRDDGSLEHIVQLWATENFDEC